MLFRIGASVSFFLFSFGTMKIISSPLPFFLGEATCLKLQFLLFFFTSETSVNPLPFFSSLRKYRLVGLESARAFLSSFLARLRLSDFSSLFSFLPFPRSPAASGVTWHTAVLFLLFFSTCRCRRKVFFFFHASFPCPAAQKKAISSASAFPFILSHAPEFATSPLFFPRLAIRHEKERCRPSFFFFFLPPGIFPFFPSKPMVARPSSFPLFRSAQTPALFFFMPLVFFLEKELHQPGPPPPPSSFFFFSW